MPNYEMIIY